MPASRGKAPEKGPEGLNPADPGIGLLAAQLRAHDPSGVVLVHCGELPGLGPGATRLVTDLRESVGARSICVQTLPAQARFDAAALWPRAHLGKDFSIGSIALAARHVRPGKPVFLAARKQKGLESLARELARLVAPPTTLERSRGYHLLCATRPERVDEDGIAEALERSYLIEHALLDDLQLEAGPGVFSRRGLDAGTAALIEDCTEAFGATPRRVLDLGCGVGPLSLWAARRWPEARVLGVDANLVALRWARHNAERALLAERVCFEASDGLPEEGAAFEEFKGAVDLALINPPTHADTSALRELLAPLRSWLRRGARALLVVARPAQIPAALEAAGARVEQRRRANYTILDARF